MRPASAGLASCKTTTAGEVQSEVSMEASFDNPTQRKCYENRQVIRGIGENRYPRTKLGDDLGFAAYGHSLVCVTEGDNLTLEFMQPKPHAHLTRPRNFGGFEKLRARCLDDTCDRRYAHASKEVQIMVRPDVPGSGFIHLYVTERSDPSTEYLIIISLKDLGTDIKPR